MPEKGDDVSLNAFQLPSRCPVPHCTRGWEYADGQNLVYHMIQLHRSWLTNRGLRSEAEGVITDPAKWPEFARTLGDFRRNRRL